MLHYCLSFAEWGGTQDLNHVAEMIQKRRSTSMSDFEISHDSGANTWHVVGAGILRFVQMTNWQYVFIPKDHISSLKLVTSLHVILW